MSVIDNNILELLWNKVIDICTTLNNRITKTNTNVSTNTTNIESLSATMASETTNGLMTKEMVTKLNSLENSSNSITDNSTATAIGNSKNLLTENSIYHGLPTINGSHNYTSNTNIYAPTNSGVSGQYLSSNDNGLPIWENYLKDCLGMDAGSIIESGLYNIYLDSCTDFPEMNYSNCVMLVMNTESNNIRQVVFVQDSNNIYSRIGNGTEYSDWELLNTSSKQSGSKTYYCTCSTTSTTLAKVVNCSDTSFTLETGVEISVLFSYANTSSSTITLNVNSTGAKSVRFLNNESSMYYRISPMSICKFIYDGTYWRMVGGAVRKESDSTSSAPLGTTTNYVTERDIYYGLPSINGVHNYSSNTKIFAPTTVGTSGQILQSNGSGAPVWKDNDTTEVNSIFDGVYTLSASSTGYFNVPEAYINFSTGSVINSSNSCSSGSGNRCKLLLRITGYDKDTDDGFCKYVFLIKNFFDFYNGCTSYDNGGGQIISIGNSKLTISLGTVLFPNSGSCTSSFATIGITSNTSSIYLLDVDAIKI